MNKETKSEIALMQSLMERMDKHLTLNESKELDSKILKENGIEEVSCKWRDVVGPEEFYDLLSSVPDGKRVTFGYVSAAKIQVPEGHKLNPTTNRMNKFSDYAALGKNLGLNGTLSGVIKLAVYNFPWQSEEKVRNQYSDYKNTRDTLAQKYNIEVGKARYQTQSMNFGDKGGVSGYNGNNADLAGHTYTNLNMKGIKPLKDVYYLVYEDGHLEEIDVSKLTMLPYVPKDTIIDKLKNAGATPDEIAPLETMNYQRFEHSHILYFSATTDYGIPTVFINTKLSEKISGITMADTKELVQVAKDKYSQYME